MENERDATFNIVPLLSPFLSSTAELHVELSIPANSLSDPREVELILSVLR